MIAASQDLRQKRARMSVLSEYYSPAADRNKGPILEVLRELFEEDDRKALEVGTGTGQHALEFSKFFPHIKWNASDVEANVRILRELGRLDGQKNIEGPFVYECGKDRPPKGPFDIVYTANTFHIMPWKSVKSFFKDLEGLRPGARLLVYGPFQYQDRELEPSNAAFHESLRERDPASGIRKFEDVLNQAQKRGLRLLKDYEMPANNRLLAFIKI